MSAGSEGTSRRREDKANEFVLALVDHAITLLREALQQGRRTDAVRLYRGHANDTAATAAAILSAWQTFARHPDEEELPEMVSMTDLAARFIRRACQRMRRKDYRDQQMAEQVARGHPRGSAGQYLPFDPADPREREEVMKNLPLEIEEVLGERSERDRRVVELWVEGHTYEEIVERVRAELPGEPVSAATVHRIIERFRDEMRGRLEDR
jgi:hypothetical protein